MHYPLRMEGGLRRIAPTRERGVGEKREVGGVTKELVYQGLAQTLREVLAYHTAQIWMTARSLSEKWSVEWSHLPPSWRDLMDVSLVLQRIPTTLPAVPSTASIAAPASPPTPSTSLFAMEVRSLRDASGIVRSLRFHVGPRGARIFSLQDS
mmetsp:Transcript_33210/g.93093  ORF Transcript_33210/g.93093 Transcript_33210/m.93093 type:complete len:152 (-) Transcript_33210:2889-3344(-)